MDTGENTTSLEMDMQAKKSQKCQKSRAAGQVSMCPGGAQSCTVLSGAGNVQLDEVARAMHVLCMDKMSQWRLHRYLKLKI